MGNLGGLSEYLGAFSQAQDFTEKALYLAQPEQAPHWAYQWQWQLGRIQQAQGQTDSAIETYQAAIETLDVARKDLLGLTPDLQFSLRDSVEPLYRNLLDLLLSEDTNPVPENQKMLAQALDIVDLIRLSELENFLQCQLFPSVTAEREVERIDAQAAFIYPIFLKDRIEIVYKFPGAAIAHRSQTINRPETEKTISALQYALKQKRFTKQVKENASSIYQLLIQPIEDDLNNYQQANSQNPIETLVFVLDDALQNIPMSVLFDGEQYLIEKYGVAVIPTRQLFDPRPRNSTIAVLSAGISEAQTVNGIFYPELPNITTELNAIEQLTTLPDTALLNKNFTEKKIKQTVNDINPRIVHIATHGQFSSNPNETFLLAWGERLKVQAVEQLLQVKPTQKAPIIDLLILSACETAEGNRRAALGLAGVAAQARVRTTLATLWQVDDAATTELFMEFYQNLKQGNTISQSLRAAQLSMLQNPDNRRPYFWAPFVIVGNWL